MGQIDLNKFCGEDNCRYSTGSPFVRGKWKYATDGRICIRVPTDEPETDVLNTRDAASLFTARIFPEPWPPADYLQGEIPCADCVDGNMRCEKCNGDEFGCDECNYTGCAGPKRKCDHSTICKCIECGGRGIVLIDCKTCNGCGLVIGDVGTMVGISFISAHYDRLIRELPNVRYSRASDYRSMIYFSFDGGEGIVMPRTDAAGCKRTEATCPTI
jgi:hypothetical protein